MIRPFVTCESRPAKIFYSWRRGNGSVEMTEVLTSFWENAKGERIGFASNWRQVPSVLTIINPDGRSETRTIAPLETIELHYKGE